jgi:hypothetical protein
VPGNYNKSSSSDNRIAVADSGRAVGKSGTMTEAGGLSIGAKGSYTAGDNLSGANITDRSNAGIQASGGSSLSFQESTDPEVINSVIGNYTESLSSILAQAQEANKAQTSAIASIASESGASQQTMLGQVFGQLTSLAENKQTEGQAATNKQLLWIVGGVLALMFLVFRKR